jgi:DNA polymerase-3 subunit epsilon
MTKIHGLTNQDVANAPTFADLAPALRQWFKGRRVIAYNAAFEARTLAQSGKAHDLPVLPPVTWACAMELYARYHGRWSKTYQSYKWQSLSDAAAQCGLSPSSTLRRAVDKAELTRVLLRFLAEGDSRCTILRQIVLNEQPKDAWGWD